MAFIQEILLTTTQSSLEGGKQIGVYHVLVHDDDDRVRRDDHIDLNKRTTH